jgi:DNA-binding NtrC family response regulator
MRNGLGMQLVSDRACDNAWVASVVASSAPPAPHAGLLRLHRRSLINVLVMGSSQAEREDVARAFHRESPLRSGPFVRVDCVLDEERFCRGLQMWMSGVFDSSNSSLLVASRGTLYLENIETLSSRAQRLLLTFVSHYTGPRQWSDGVNWGGRLVVGSEVHLGDQVIEARFLEPLYDCLDKARIELESSWQWGVA